MGFRKDIKDDIDLLQKEYGDLSELVYRLSNRLDNLFKRDHNKTLRPKIDLLDDRFYDFESEVWEALGKLQDRIEKLEKAIIK